MLQIDHRESRDVDLFLQDPQLLAFLDPQKHDFEFEIGPATTMAMALRISSFVAKPGSSADRLRSMSSDARPISLLLHSAASRNEAVVEKP